MDPDPSQPLHHVHVLIPLRLQVYLDHSSLCLLIYPIYGPVPECATQIVCAINPVKIDDVCVCSNRISFGVALFISSPAAHHSSSSLHRHNLRASGAIDEERCCVPPGYLPVKILGFQ